MKILLLFICTFFPSILRLLVWRLLGFKVGKGVHVSIFSVVVADFIDIGSGTTIDALTLIYRPSNFQIGQRSRIGSYVRIIGLGGDVTLGSQSFIGLGCLIETSKGFNTGARSQIAPRTLIYSHGASGLTFNVRFPYRFGPVIIGEDTWIGMGCMIFPNVTIGKKVIIYPGSRIFNDQKDGTTILPYKKENQKINTNHFIMGGVSDKILRDRILELFEECANYLGSRVVNEKYTSLWKIEKKKFPAVYLVLEETTEINNFLHSLPASLIWKLHHDNSVKTQSTIFSFNDWTIYGPMTVFSEKIADLLMRIGGPHFIYNE